MLPAATVPSCLLSVLEGVRGVFTAPTFATFTSLVTGLLGATGSRTVTGMWSAAGLAGRSHHARAHRFFSHARWDPDSLGLLVARLVVARFVPAGTTLSVVVDDTLFHRYGRKTHGVFWQHDGSAKGRNGIGRGNCFVAVGLVVAVPFLTRAVCLPVLFRLHIPTSGVSKPDAARTLPGNATFTTRLASNAVLYALPPAPTGKRGHPAWKGARLGTCADLAATATWRTTSVTRYGTTDTVHIATIVCLWWGSLHRTPVTVVLVRDTDSTRPYDIALVSTDTGADPETIVARYADRWSVVGGTVHQGLEDPDRGRRRGQPAPPRGGTQCSFRDAGSDRPRPLVRRARHPRNGPGRRPRPSTLEPEEDPREHRRHAHRLPTSPNYGHQRRPGHSRSISRQARDQQLSRRITAKPQLPLKAT